MAHFEHFWPIKWHTETYLMPTPALGNPGSPGICAPCTIESTTTTEATTTTQDTRCTGQHDEKITLNTPSGRFLKIICHRHISANFDEARENCERYGIKLLRIENGEVQQALFTYYQRNRTQRNTGRIDGIKNEHGQWHYYFSNNRSMERPVYQNFIWHAGRQLYNTMAISNLNFPNSNQYAIDSLEHTDRDHGFICQLSSVQES
jgi:hypothetical protein